MPSSLVPHPAIYVPMKESVSLRSAGQFEKPEDKIRHNMNEHLSKYLVDSKADLSSPSQVIEDLIKQRDIESQDTDKVIAISQALYAISQ